MGYTIEYYLSVEINEVHTHAATWIFFFFFFFGFLGLYQQHMEVPRLGVELELHLQPIPQLKTMLDL